MSRHAMSKMSRVPSKVRRSITKPLPTVPGVYFWDTWGAPVEVYKKKGGRRLYVTPPIVGGIEVCISGRIAGTFVPYVEK